MSLIKIFQCDVCGRFKDDYQRLLEHKTSNLRCRKYTFKCELCNKEHLTERQLQQHLDEQHDKSGTYLCFICLCSFKKKDSILHHSCRLEEKLKCNLCDHQAVSIRYMKRHMNSKHRSPVAIECQYCDKIFHNQYSYDCHREKKHDQENYIECEGCYRKFKNEEDKIDHLCLIDTFKCHFCQVEFSNEDYLIKHGFTCDALLAKFRVDLPHFELKLNPEAFLIKNVKTVHGLSKMKRKHPTMDSKRLSIHNYANRLKETEELDRYYLDECHFRHSPGKPTVSVCAIVGLDGIHDFRVIDGTVASEEFINTLEKMRELPQNPLLMMDNASSHRTLESRKAIETFVGRSNGESTYLPKTFSKQLNPIEPLFTLIKQLYYGQVDSSIEKPDVKLIEGLFKSRSNLIDSMEAYYNNVTRKLDSYLRV